MNRIIRKYLALGLAACLLAAPGPALAETAAGFGAPEKLALGDKLSSGISLERAISTVKATVSIPSGLDNFNSDYNEYNGKSYWHLQWSTLKAPQSNFSVSVNAHTGEITSINYYRGYTPGQRYSGLPKYSRDEALELAVKFAGSTIPDKFSQTLQVPDRQAVEPLPMPGRDYPMVHHFTFSRAQGGIPVAAQGITVGVNGENGEIMSFNLNWDDGAALPSASGNVGLDRARSIFLAEAGYELTYFMSRPVDDPDRAGPLTLVYRPKTPGNFVLDALTGKIISSHDMYFEVDGMYGGSGDRMSEGYNLNKEEEALSPAEERVLQETRDLVPLEKAQALAESLVPLPAGFSLTGRSLDRNYEVPGSRIWRFTYADDDRRNYQGISIDARTGELLGFSKDKQLEGEDALKEPQGKLTQAQAEKIAADYIAGLQPARAGQVVLRQLEPEVGPLVRSGAKPLPSGYYLTYARMVNNVVYPENGFRVRVHSGTGEVTMYNMTWWNTSFPSPGQNIMDVAKVNQALLRENPLTLSYTRGHSRWDLEGRDEAKYYLIYSLQGGYKPLIDAVTGKELDYRGNPVTERVTEITDIAGHASMQDIMLLFNQGIIDGDNIDQGRYRPDEPVTVAHLSALLVRALKEPYYVGPAAEGPWHKKYIDAALEMGILEGDMSTNPMEPVGRLQMARMIVNAAGYGKLARLSHLFNLDVADAGEVPGEYKGYVAAAVGLGYIPVEGGKFLPDRQVKRGEAASMLVKMLR